MSARLSLSGSGAAANAVVIGPVPMERFQSVSIHTTATAFTGTLAMQGSNDGVTWVSVRLQNASNTDSIAGGITAPSTALRGDPGFRYFRAVVSAYTSGTIEAVAYFTDRSLAPQSKTIFPAS